MFSAASVTVPSSTETSDSPRRRGIARLAASVVASGLVMAGTLVGAGSAVADDATHHPGGAAAVLDGLKTYDRAVLHTNGKNQQLPAGVFEMTVDGGGKLKTYCIDIHNPTQDRAKYLETPWGQTSLGGNKNAGKIRWILEHSYPQVDDLAALAKEAGTGPLTEKTAAAGTQVAIWRYSDDVDVEATDKAAEELADWLEKSAVNQDEPKASLALDPAAVSGKSGERLGPITVHTNAGQASVTPPADAASGVKITDKDGRPVTGAANGAQIYFDVPAGAADGSASLTVQATTSVPVGRAFAGVTKSQTMILAGSSESTVSANATATWAKKGAIPAVSAEKNCTKGGVDVTATNKGDEAFTFELAGKKHTVEAGKSETVTVPVGEDQAYDITVTGPEGFSKTFKGVLDCKTGGSKTGGGHDTQTEGEQPAPATSGGSAGTTDSTGDLAETGGSSATPVIAGVAIALVVVGGGAVFLLRRRKEQPSAQ
ncbi:LAETG motif-containing sortase-dependent surface protein [Streptomyces sp. NPDC056061]|uniref:LAETG motif-containing sortase-dependent surface protein n=1 Tax=Streptomyces sp. NPDC056061 TaxID=3345700 RepID=UPI0035DA4B3F